MCVPHPIMATTATLARTPAHRLLSRPRPLGRRPSQHKLGVCRRHSTWTRIMRTVGAYGGWMRGVCVGEAAAKAPSNDRYYL